MSIQNVDGAADRSVILMNPLLNVVVTGRSGALRRMAFRMRSTWRTARDSCQICPHGFGFSALCLLAALFSGSLSPPQSLQLRSYRSIVNPSIIWSQSRGAFLAQEL